MDYVRRLILICISCFSINAFAVNTYTPPLQVQLIAKAGGAYVGSASETCFGSMSALSTLNSPTNPYVVVNTCNDNKSSGLNSDTLSSWYPIFATYKYGNGATSSSGTSGYNIQTCQAGETKSGSYPNVVCTVPNCVAPSTWNSVTNSCNAPCIAGQNDLSGDLFSGTCVNGCTHWTQGSGVYVRESGGVVWYVSLRANTGASCVTSSKSKVSADAAIVAAAVQKDVDAAAAAAAKTAADKLAAQNAATAAATAKTAADKAVADAKTAADKAAAVAADPNSTQAQKDAANAAATAAQANADTKNGTAATAAGTSAAAAKDDTKPEEKEFCEAHPTSIICKNSSVTKGTCSNGVLSGFTCDGDVATCAIAQSEAESACLISATDDALTNKYNEAKNDNPSNNPSLPQNATTINIPSALDDSSPYAGQCNPDTVISFNGASVTIPFSKWCDVLNALGYLFLACAYISAAIILGGAV